MNMNKEFNNNNKEIFNNLQSYDNEYDFEKVGIEALPYSNMSLICRGFFASSDNPECKIVRDGKYIEGFWVYGLVWFDNGKPYIIGSRKMSDAFSGTNAYVIVDGTLCRCTGHWMGDRYLFENDVVTCPGSQNKCVIMYDHVDYRWIKLDVKESSACQLTYNSKLTLRGTIFDPHALHELMIIKISGKARHGKDTVAELLSNRLTKLGYKVKIMHNADLLKYIYKEFFGWNGEKDEKGRNGLQHLGCYVRENDPDYWVNFLISMINLFASEWDFVLIPDCRFKNEISKFDLTDYKNIHVRVEREGFESDLTPEQKQHISEIDLDDVVPDYLIKNDGDLLDLEAKITELIENIL